MAGEDVVAGGGQYDPADIINAAARSFVDSVGLPSVPTPSRGSYVDAKTLVAQGEDNTRAYEKQYKDLVANLKRSLNTDYKVVGDGSSGKIQRLVPDVSAASSSDYAGGKADRVGVPAGWKWAPVGPDDPVQSMYDVWQAEEDQLSRLKSDIKGGLHELAGDGGGGTLDAATAYRNSEQLKTKEITRQYNDFADRADELYQLMKEEQAAGMAADDQNYQNMLATQRTGQIFGDYGHVPYMASLSRVLRPSLPDYVRPDYRLNQAVGLPGPEGFDNPNYDENGMPLYAYGTVPKPRYSAVGDPVAIREVVRRMGARE